MQDALRSAEGHAKSEQGDSLKHTEMEPNASSLSLFYYFCQKAEKRSKQKKAEYKKQEDKLLSLSQKFPSACFTGVRGVSALKSRQEMGRLGDLFGWLETSDLL